MSLENEEEYCEEKEEKEENEEEYLYVGEIVTLKSGGPAMTVSAVDDEDATWVSCVWFTDGNYFENSFSIDSLLERKE